MMNRRGFIVGVGSGLAVNQMFADGPIVPDLTSAARDAWLFALSPIMVAALRARPNPRDGQIRPMNVFAHNRSLAGDGHGQFEGDGLYCLHLPEPIPVDAFWSLTMYKALTDGRFFLAENPLNRYSIGDRPTGLVRGPGGSLDIWIGRSDSGGSRTANWLPAPGRDRSH